MQINYDLKRRILMTFAIIYFFICAVMSFAGCILWNHVKEDHHIPSPEDKKEKVKYY